MTVTIVAVFALCWLPYVTMALWYMIDRSSASRVSPLVQDLLFAMAVSNSCVNPLVYGSFSLRPRAALKRLLKNSCCGSASSSDTIGNSSSSKNKNNLDTAMAAPVKSSRVRGVRFAETSFTAVPEPPRPPRAPRPPPRAPA